MTTSDTTAPSNKSLERTTKYFPIRRSTRLPLEVPLRVTSLDPNVKFAHDCTTVTVSAHGCGLVSPQPLASGTRVQLEIVSDKQTTRARVLEVVPLDDQGTSWLLGMEMERPGNFWGIKYAPADWAEEISAEPEQPAVAKASTSAAPTPQKAAPRPSPLPTRMAFHPSRKKPPAPTKELPAAVLRRLLSECRLCAISVGACYVQTGTTFPMHAPVKVSVLAAGSEHGFKGTVRMEHVGAGMGIQFSDRGDEHNDRIAKLIEALSATGDKVPEVRVELSAPDKNSPLQSKSALAAAAQFDSLLSLILSGGSLKRTQFLQELEKQRSRS